MNEKNIILEKLPERILRITRNYQLNIIIIVILNFVWLCIFDKILDNHQYRVGFHIILIGELISVIYSIIRLRSRFISQKGIIEIISFRFDFKNINNVNYILTTLVPVSLTYITSPFIVNNIFVAATNLLFIFYGLVWDWHTWQFIIAALITIVFMISSTEYCTRYSYNAVFFVLEKIKNEPLATTSCDFDKIVEEMQKEKRAKSGEKNE